jgi:ATP:ADP antiporter, AAA family
MIRKSEIRLVEKLFIFEFFQGAAIALYFTTAISIFLEQKPTSELPFVFILSAILLWIFGFIYSKLESKVPFRTVILTVLFFNLAAIVLFRLLMQHQADTWFLFLFLAFFNVLYLLNNLEFWGLSALLFDVRQSKRLFGIVSAGDIPAKMLGYLIAFVMIPFIGTANLLWVAALLMSIAFIIYQPLMSIANVDRLEKPSPHHRATFSIKSISLALKVNPLIRKIALVSFFSFCCMITVVFVFYGYVKQEFENDKDLATFFAIFFAIVRGLTLLIKLAGTNRLVNKIGLKKSLVFTPVLLFFLCLPALYFSGQDNFVNTFYMFGVVAVMLEVLRSAILTPVLLSSMQPLPTHQRLRGHTIIKGFMDPVAFFFTGIVLLILPSVEGKVDFSLVSLFLLLMIIGWIYFSLSVEKDYINTLKVAVRDRTLNARDISITDKDSLSYLMNRLMTGSEKEAISVLQLISSQPAFNKEFLENALNHKSSNVQLYALNIIKLQKATELLPAVKNLLQATGDTKQLSHVINTISAIAPKEDLSEYINHPDPEVAHSAILALLLQSDLKTNKNAASELENLFASTDSKDRIKALQLAGELNSHTYSSKVVEMMKDPSPVVRQASRKAAAKIGTAELINALLIEYASTNNGAEILEALASGGPSTLSGIKDFLFQHKCNGAKSRKLVSLLGKMGGTDAVKLLEECLRRFPENANPILLSLHQANIKSSDSEKQYILTIRENLVAASHMVFKIQFATQHYTHQIVTRALELELLEIRNKCLWLFSFLYDSEKIKRAQIGFDLNTKESVANALELINVTVPKEFAIPFSILYENAPIEDKCMQLRKSVHPPLLTDAALVKNILFDVDYIFNSWTKSCVLYSLAENKVGVNMEFIEPFRNSENKVLKNTADFLVEKYALN